MQQNVNVEEITRRARKMTVEALRWSANDASEAALAAEALERDGSCRGKSGGYYRDEATIYRTELRRRGFSS